MLCKSFFLIVIICIINLLFLYFYQYNNVSILKPWLPSHEKPGSLSKPFDAPQKQLKIIYYKTHKTASTTVGSILFRLGAQHGIRFLPAPDHYYTFDPPPFEVDITLNHHRSTNMDFKKMMAHYKKLVPNGKFLSVLREPKHRYLSYYHYYYHPEGGWFDDYIKNEYYNNGMVRDFGVHYEMHFEKFMETAYNQFFFLITEKLDDTLLLLKNAWGWTLQDILYITLNDACSKGKNHEGKIMNCTQLQYANLTAERLQKMTENNKLDLIFYERALNDTNTMLALQPPSFWNELAIFKHMLRELQILCGGKNHPDECEPYYWDDANYEKKIRAGKGWVPDYPIFTADFGLS